MPFCIGRSCDGKEDVEYMHGGLDAKNSPVLVEFVSGQPRGAPSESKRSGAQSTRMRYGAAMASAD